MSIKGRMGIVAIVAGLVVVTGFNAMALDSEHVIAVDVVALINGEEIEGDRSIAAGRGKFTYWFANAENRDAFEADPERYEVQLGGACGSMGPLSGEGRTDLYTVYDRRVYLFASQGCRARFLRTPERLIDRDDPAPWVTPSRAEEGLALLNRAIEAIGGKDAVGRLFSLQYTREWDTEQYHRVVQWTIALPDHVARTAAWDDYEYSVVTGSHEGWFTYDDETIHTLEPAQRMVLSRTIRSHPIATLALLDLPETIIARIGEETVTMPDESQNDVDLVAVARNGMTTTLGIDRETGLPVLTRFRGRGAGSFVGDFVQLYDEFKVVNGLKLPHRVHTTFDGQPYAEETGRFTVVEVNRDEHRSIFVRDKSNL